MSIARKILMGSAGAGSKSTYIDDVFSTYLYKGDDTQGSTKNNGIDLSSKGGLVWLKARTIGRSHLLYDTERGATKFISSSDDNFETTLNTLGVVQFNNNGFNLGSHDSANGSNNDYTSWTFRKAKGFFDVVTWSGGGETYKNISHNLGSVPGCIIVKKYAGGSGDWFVYHRELNNGTNSWQYRVALNKNWNEASAGQSFFYSAPTATQFQIGDWFTSSGNDYIAYVFAGGESNTDKAVDFDGNDFLSFANTSDFVFGTGAYTVEFFINPDTTPNGNIIFSGADTNGFVINMTGSSVNINKYSVGDVVSSTSSAPVGEWTHYAFVREGTGSNQTKIYVNGKLDQTGTDSNNWTVNANWGLGARNSDGGFGVDGKISNFRITKGQAVYKHNFNVPHDPLTQTSQGANSSNVKLLCCNGSTTTASTVTPGTITANGDPAVTTNNSIFDDPEGYKFGEEGDQNIIRCGSYVGKGNASVEVDLGWEPQWVLVKNKTSTSQWVMFDSMRGVVSNGVDERLVADDSAAEGNFGANFLDFTSKGFIVKIQGNSEMNQTNNTHIFVAIRRPDGLVGKPAEAGTDVFTTVASPNNTNEPLFVSNFIVDFALQKSIGSTSSWFTGARLTGDEYLNTNSNSSKGNMGTTYQTFDMNDGWWNGGAATQNGYNSWMWKRHAGFDVVTYTGNGTAGTEISHSLNKSPEMIWIKRRDATGNAGDWMVGHKGLYGGSSPWNGYLVLNKTQGQFNDQNPFYNVAPTSTVFTLDSWDRVNANNSDYIAMLFASVDGISKCGYYDGSDSAQTITTGFQPRFVIIKNITQDNENWITFDTTRGWGPGSDEFLYINTTAAQNGTWDWGAPTSTGFTLTSVNDTYNSAGEKFIYYAHA